MAAAWKKLLAVDVTEGHQIPPMLVSASFQSNSYTIQLTDLTYIWTESLERKQLLSRSLKVCTSIDPTENDQLPIFMEKLRLGIEGGKNTAATIQMFVDSGRPIITIKITVNLPKGVAPLEWPFILNRSPQSMMTTQFLLPLLRTQHVHIQKTAGLVELLREKDHVIQKMLDKFESQDLDLGQVFPQAITKGARKADRKKATEKVPGLHLFDVEAFRQNLDSGFSLDTANLVKSMFGVDNQRAIGVQTSMTLPTDESSWWEAVRDQNVVLSRSLKSRAIATAAASPKTKPDRRKTRESSSEEDNFQVQATPTGSQITKNAAATLPVDNSSEDENDLDAAASQRSKVADSQRETQRIVSSPKPSKVGRTNTTDESQPKSKSLDKLRGKQNPKITHHNSDSGEDGDDLLMRPKTRATSENKADKLAGDSDTDDEEPAPIPGKNQGKLGTIGGKKAAPPPPSSSSEDEALAMKPARAKGKLGTLGGKKKAVTTSTSTDQNSEHEDSSLRAASRAKKKLGTIGGRGKAGSVKAASPARSVNKDDTPVPEETVEERADKKRLLLKRALEEKSKQPVKKRKKF
ncbi:XRCC4-like factor-domain-containing protein [Calycina marina]|uniref:Non-homologous end-joining factor 1 n=1 Tax=Calycina marina TaxID=1763456 RepID=A0A9P7YX03_9HELO|nr:XRCC4-like factor-domain-containing protein [Calycina marina]